MMLTGGASIEEEEDEERDRTTSRWNNNNRSQSRPRAPTTALAALGDNPSDSGKARSEDPAGSSAADGSKNPVSFFGFGGGSSSSSSSSSKLLARSSSNEAPSSSSPSEGPLSGTITSQGSPTNEMSTSVTSAAGNDDDDDDDLDPEELALRDEQIEWWGLADRVDFYAQVSSLLVWVHCKYFCVMFTT